MKFRLIILLILYCLRGYAQGALPQYYANEFNKKGGAVLYNSRDILFGKVKSIINTQELYDLSKKNSGKSNHILISSDTVHFEYQIKSGFVRVGPDSYTNRYRYFYPKYFDKYFSKATIVVDTAAKFVIMHLDMNGNIIGNSLLNKGDSTSGKNAYYNELYKYKDFKYLKERSIYNVKNERELKEVYSYDAANRLSRIECFSKDDQVIDQVDFIYKSFDKYKNWTKRIELRINNYNQVIAEVISTRKISYYPERHKLKPHR